jgi:hypothetical protein
MQPTGSMVVTTIFDPVLLEDYYDNLRAHGHLERCTVFVIADEKTPRAAYARCESLRRRGMHVVCPTLEQQEDFLRQFALRPEFVPRNTDNRRNIGFLMALAGGADFLISIDDDNYCRSGEDFFGEHAVVCGSGSTQNVVDDDSGWFNICDLLELEPHTRVYPRGFPYFARHREVRVTNRQAAPDIHMNAGLWLFDPDLDAITWLVSPTRSVSVSGTPVVLSRNTWTPVNTQNTALRMSAVPSYYYIRMGYPLAGAAIDRYGDIFSGYFAQACVKHVGGAVRVGTPVAEHRRNSHDYMRDAAQEIACMQMLEDVLPWLHGVRLEGRDVSEAYQSLSYALDDAVEGFRGRIWTDPARAYFHSTAHAMREWVRVCRTIIVPYVAAV